VTDLTEASLAAALAAIPADAQIRLKPTHMTFECGEQIEAGDPVVWRDGKLWRAPGLPPIPPERCR
jgi:hypothetical protein